MEAVAVRPDGRARFAREIIGGIRQTAPKLIIGVPIVNISAGSPYYNPHIQRPALFPPSDDYYRNSDAGEAVRKMMMKKEKKKNLKSA